MRKVAIGLAVGVLALVLAGTVDAHPARVRVERHREVVRYTAPRAYVRGHTTFVRPGPYLQTRVVRVDRRFHRR